MLLLVSCATSEAFMIPIPTSDVPPPKLRNPVRPDGNDRLARLFIQVVNGMSVNMSGKLMP